MKRKRLNDSVSEFESDPSLENAADVYESFIRSLRLNGITLEDVVIKAVKRRHYEMRDNIERDVMPHHTKDGFVTALLDVAVDES